MNKVLAVEKMKERGSNSVLFWFKARTDKVYHAYRSRTRGTPSVCGGGAEIATVGDMDTGSSRSKCCVDCFLALYNMRSLAAVNRRGVKK